MATYVDELRQTGKAKLPMMCHLMADSENELETFARKLGLDPIWRHRDHYDLSAGKRYQAVLLGAVEITAREMVALRKRLEEDKAAVYAAQWEWQKAEDERTA